MIPLLIGQTPLCCLPLSQFGLFRQPQTSFTRLRNRKSFTTLRRASPQRRLTHSAENHAYEHPRRNRTVAWSRRSDSIRKSRRFESLPHFSRRSARLERMTSAFCKPKRKAERAFPLIRKHYLHSPMFFNGKNRWKQQGNGWVIFLFRIKSLQSSYSLSGVRVYFYRIILGKIS